MEGVAGQDQTIVSHATNVTHLPSSSFSLTHFYLPTLLQLLANLIDVFTQYVCGGWGGGGVGVGIEHSVMASIYLSVPQIGPPPPITRISPHAFLVQSLAKVFLSHPPEEDSSCSRNIDNLSHPAVYR